MTDENYILLPKQGKKPKKRRAIKKTFTESSDLRQLAEGESCTLQLQGICNHNCETTVLAHISRKGFGSMGSKPHDLSAVHACSDCHDVIDNRVQQNHLSEDEINIALFDGLLATLDRALRAGLITL